MHASRASPLKALLPRYTTREYDSPASVLSASL